MSPPEIADQYDLPVSQVREALPFYEAHRIEIDAAIASEAVLETEDAKTAPGP